MSHSSKCSGRKKKYTKGLLYYKRNVIRYSILHFTQDVDLLVSRGIILGHALTLSKEYGGGLSWNYPIILISEKKHWNWGIDPAVFLYADAMKELLKLVKYNTATGRALCSRKR